MNRVKAAVFSFTPPVEGDPELGDYLRWHLLDHSPEQYQLPGILLATRWMADGDYPGARIAGSGPIENVGSVMCYLVGEPVQQTHDEFMQLGARLAEVGRFPYRRPSLQLRMPALLRWYASPSALVSPEVVPWRPHRGVLMVVEEPAAGGVVSPEWLRWLHIEHFPRLMAEPGVAGAWMFGTTATWQLHPNCQGPRQYTTVVYLDEDPLSVSARLAPLVQERWGNGRAVPAFAGPMRSMVHWDAWPASG